MTSVAIVKPELGKHSLASELRPANQPESLPAFCEQSGRPGVTVAGVAFALAVIRIHAVVRLSTGRTPEFRERVEFESKTRMSGSHNTVRCKFVARAEVAGQAKGTSLCDILRRVHAGGQVCLTRSGGHVVMCGQPIMRTTMARLATDTIGKMKPFPPALLMTRANLCVIQHGERSEG